MFIKYTECIILLNNSNNVLVNDGYNIFMIKHPVQWLDDDYNSNLFIKTFKSMMLLSASRDSTLEVLKGFVMLLVVMGHLTTGDIIPHQNLWYENLKQAIYSFHMPLFFILSGIIFQMQSRYLVNNQESLSNLKSIYLNYIIERSKRLLVPFLIIGVFITLAKYIFQPPPELGAAPLSLPMGLLRIIYETEQSPTRFIWFLFVLYILSIIFLPFIIRFDKYARRNLILVGVLVMFLGLFFISPWMADILYFNRFARHAIFFVIGLIVFYKFQEFSDWSKKILPLSLIMFGVLLSISLSYDFSNVARFCFMGLISFIFLLPLCDYFTDYSGLILKIIAKYSFVIFLFNLPFIGLSKMVILKTFGWSPIIFNYTVIFIYLSGIIGPILLKIFIFDKIPIINRYTN